MVPMAERRGRGMGRHVGEEWIDAVGDIVEAEAQILTMGLRYCRRAFVAMVGTTAQVASTSADIASGTVRAAERRTSSVAEAMQEGAERSARSSRRMTQRPHDEENGVSSTLSAEALDALTVDMLDRLAMHRDVDGYPNGGTKAEKADALADARIDLDDLSVEMLDKLAEANDVDDYPRSSTKRDKIDALSMMVPQMSRR